MLLAAMVAVVAMGCVPGSGQIKIRPGSATLPTPGSSPTRDPDAMTAPVDPADVTWPDVHGVEGGVEVSGFRTSESGITAELAARMSSSWREGCPVPLSDLRYVTVTHWTFEGTEVQGELVVHADVVNSATAVFQELHAQGFAIRSMRLVDDFGGSDDASMAADNTSAFNCRPVAGGTGWSEHAYGRAIDINPRENPYLRGGRVLPPEGAPYADRPDEPGVVQDPQVAAFAAQGWSWGGDWTDPVDLQHFSTTGR